MRLSVIKSVSTLLLFIVLGFGIYSNTMEVPFTLDDKRIYDNPHIRLEKLTLKEIKKAASNKFSAQKPNLALRYGNIATGQFFYDPAFAAIAQKKRVAHVYKNIISIRTSVR